jgi:hypothetical protein
MLGRLFFKKISAAATILIAGPTQPRTQHPLFTKNRQTPNYPTPHAFSIRHSLSLSYFSLSLILEFSPQQQGQMIVNQQVGRG